MSNTIKLVQKLTRQHLKNKNDTLKSGNICMFRYDARDKTQVFDRTPLIIILRESRSYILGLNFNWCPKPMRKIFWKFILKINKKKIKENKLLDIEWSRVKPFILKLGYAPIIRLYIRKRISRKVVDIPYSYMPEICEMNTADITGYSENKAYRHMRAQPRK